MSAEAQHRHDEALLDAETDWLSDPDDHLTQVFPDTFGAPCRECQRPTLSSTHALCASCEADLEGGL